MAEFDTLEIVGEDRGEGGALALLTFHVDLPSVVVDNLMADR